MRALNQKNIDELHPISGRISSSTIQEQGWDRGISLVDQDVKSNSPDFAAMSNRAFRRR